MIHCSNNRLIFCSEICIQWNFSADFISSGWNICLLSTVLHNEPMSFEWTHFPWRCCKALCASGWVEARKRQLKFLPRLFFTGNGDVRLPWKRHVPLKEHETPQSITVALMEAQKRCTSCFLAAPNPDRSFLTPVQVLDKGTLDALLCGTHALQDAYRMNREVLRVLKPGGVCLDHPIL